MATRYFSPREQVSDALGRPMPGAKLYFYETGTSTPAVTYSDAGLTVPNANPVIADASGRFGDIFFSTDALRVILRGPDDTVIWTADPLMPNNIGDGEVLVPGGSEPITLADQAGLVLFAEHFGATGDGVTDDAPAIQAALNTGRNVSLRSGSTYRLLSGLSIMTDRQFLFGNGAKLVPVGNFDMLTFGGTQDHKGFDNVQIEASGMSGGRIVYVNNSNRTYLSKLMVYNAFNGIEVRNTNNATLQEINLANTRGDFGYRVSGDGGGRTDLARLYACGVSFTEDAALVRRAIGLWLYGEANSVEMTNVHIVRPGVGIKAQANGAGGKPFGLVCHGTAASDYSAFENVYLEAGEDFYFGTGFYGHAAGWGAEVNGIRQFNEVSAVYIGPNVLNVQFAGGKITDPRCNNIVANGQGLSVTGMKLVQNQAAGNGGRYNTVFIGGTARSIRIVGNEMGMRDGGGAQVAYQVFVQAGASRITIGDNRGDGYFCSFLHDETTPGANEVDHWNNGGSFCSESNGIRFTTRAGTGVYVTPVVSSGSVIALPVLNKGSGFWVMPPSYEIIGDGTGAAAAVSLDGEGGLNVSLTAGGSGYTWANFLVRPAVIGYEIRPGGPGTNGQDITMRGRGGGAVVLGNDRGVGFAAVADANAVNYLRTVGRAAGAGVVLEAFGTDANIDLVLRRKGTGLVQIEGNISATPPAATSGIRVKGENGQTYILHATLAP